MTEQITTEQTLNLHQIWRVVIPSKWLFASNAGDKTHSRSQMERVYSCHSKRCWKKDRFLVSLQTPAAMLNLYESHTRPRMEYCCHILAGAAQSSPSSFDRIQQRLRGLVLDILFLQPSTFFPQTKRLQHFTTIQVLLRQLGPPQLEHAMPCS